MNREQIYGKAAYSPDKGPVASGGNVDVPEDVIKVYEHVVS